MLDMPDRRTNRAESSSDRDALSDLFRSGRMNAMIAWALVGALVLVLFESLLDADWVWVLFVGVTGTIVVFVSLTYRDWRMMLPWELLFLALLPIVTRAVLGGELGTFAYYLSVAALALLIIVQLDMFTPLKLTHWFAVVIVVMTTMAAAAVWAIVRWNMDVYLGTTFLLEPGVSQVDANTQLMVEFAWVTAAGLAAGVLFDAYFRRRGRRLRRLLGRVARR